ncbi:MAG: aldo/keto reductase [Candidatus Eremiobacterota bacterium]
MNKKEITGTAMRAEKIEREKGFTFTELGKTGFMVSRAGFGCYRVTENKGEHFDALTKALREGINIIDTSTNYMWGESELLVGKVVEELVEEGELKRDEVVIVSKIGYVQGPAMEISKERIKEGNPFPDMVYYDENCWHCIHPEFLQDQLTRSLDRLDMEKLDVLLLHNPEYFLSLAKKKGTDRKEAEKEYYARIEKAFIYLEEEAEKGRISWYGISSNTFPVSNEEFEHTSLEKILDIAGNISKNNRFAVIQFPANLYEGGAIYNKNRKSMSLLDIAGEANLGTLVNRPLNAYKNNQLIRLSDFAIKAKISDKDVEEELKEFTVTENNMKKELKYVIEGFSDILTDRWNSFSGIEHWNMVRDNYFIQMFYHIIHVNEVKDKETDK